MSLKDVLLEYGWSEEGAQFILERQHDPTMEKLIARLQGIKLKKRRATTFQKQSIPIDLRWQVWERDNFSCQHCGSRKYLTIDHIRPEILGGTLELENLQTLCATCNSRKGSRRPSEAYQPLQAICGLVHPELAITPARH